MLSETYFFYLAFENSVCKDYVTEKLYEAAKLPIIPIVLKRSLYVNLVPRFSVIATDDFASPKALADHLYHLMRTPKSYLKFLEWKAKYTVEVAPWRISVEPLPYPEYGWCKICSIIAQNRISKTYADIDHWFVTKSECDEQFIEYVL